MKQNDSKDMNGSCDVTFLEATGDSEADYNPTKGEYAYEIYAADDDDDAQSCSYDDSETSDAAELSGYNESLNKYDDDDDEDGKKDCFYGTSYCEDDEMAGQHYKSCVSDDDSSQELMDEMEKNRLFWEACLAS
ncbi:hypothetical protein RIF29_25056 [Crotalaria pallida]|uniref:Uncharacterized protein n=1 Tax=Crotalaria pallida TaxID=3830 RepID=A0AAN9HZG2_CROPI